MSLQQLIDEDRRLCILRCLNEAEGCELNENLLARMVEHFRLGIIGQDILRGHLTWLSAQSLVTVDELDRQGGLKLWVAKLTALGQGVARGRKWPGVAELPLG
ncbi:hypothetical protein [Falsiroseomonas sp.]|uniref:VpaChn25_0724 family phage protein n=1 Tax=Falsiroseomonas sp. TaxID=2870721 RepID=UPI002720F995|nr:hypothetical protein [Falsiroseomonas sp.]MDO9499024.1 hypothetical protein [Falsiroseomonas sp.]